MMFGSLISTVLKAVFMRSRPYQEWNNFGFYFITDVLQKRVPYNGDYMSYHWLSDVLASLLFGLFLAKKYRDNLDPSSLNDLS